MAEIDERTVAYVLENRRHFEDLQQVTAQLAGLLVLAAAGAGRAAPDHPLLQAADRLFEEAVDGLRRAQIPVRARPHHAAVLQAAAAVRASLDAAHAGLERPGGAVDIDPILIPLRAGYAHLQRAAHALPGFELVAFDQGCCGKKRDVEPQSTQSSPRIPKVFLRGLGGLGG
jgi:hypothetical protein